MDLRPIAHMVEEARLLGTRKLAFRVRYELENRLGLRARRTPIGSPPTPSPAADSFDHWFATLPQRLFIVQRARELRHGDLAHGLRARLNADDIEQILARAEAATRGTIRAFSRDTLDYGHPIDWHLNPRTDARWPRDHWSAVLSHGKTCGDVKFTWEINRFPHVYDWVRAFALTGSPRWPRALARQLSTWETANPYRAGVNWSSGQELAIRLIAWTFGVTLMGHHQAFSDEDFQRFARLAYLHAEHIEENIDYARLAVHNNHLIGEALGLYLVGALFPSFAPAARWRRLGRELLLRDGLDQFRPDGGYCQSSHNYHRLALHYYLWAWQLGAFDADRRKPYVRSLLARSKSHLEAMSNHADGRLPNWGANDGALLNPWTACDYADFRPLLESIGYLVGAPRRTSGGPWDEELMWFFGPNALDTPHSQSPPRADRKYPRSFPTSGLHVLRSAPDTFAVMRCGSVTDRFGQADQLHVDLWRNGINVAIDGGSYCYNDELAYHRWFMGTASHNTVSVDGHDQMLLARRFKWLYWTKADLVDIEDRRLTGRQHGYARLGVIHERSLCQLDHGWRIVDTLQRRDTSPRTFRLHWLLLDSRYHLDQTSTNHWQLTLGAPALPFKVSIECLIEGAPQAAQLDVKRAETSPAPVGWQSRYYGQRLPALSVICTVRSDQPLRFRTTFDFADTHSTAPR